MDFAIHHRCGKGTFGAQAERQAIGSLFQVPVYLLQRPNERRDWEWMVYSPQPKRRLNYTRKYAPINDIPHPVYLGRRGSVYSYLARGWHGILAQYVGLIRGFSVVFSAIGQSTEHAHYNPRHVYSPVSVVQWSVATVTTALEGTSGAHNGEEISPSVLWRE